MDSSTLPQYALKKDVLVHLFSRCYLRIPQTGSFIKNKDLAWRDGLVSEVSEVIVAQAGGLELDVPEPRSGMHL